MKAWLTGMDGKTYVVTTSDLLPGFVVGLDFAECIWWPWAEEVYS